MISVHHYNDVHIAERIQHMTKKATRKKPTNHQLDERSSILNELGKMSPLTDVEKRLIEHGNSKTGFSNKNIEAVYVWNIPAVATCPGASNWCKKHCYNGDYRDKFPHDKWRANWEWFESDHKDLSDKLCTLLNREKKTAMRIHSSGDFYSKKYIEFWLSVVEECPNTLFWAYTRSWVIPKLISPLRLLHQLPNIQLFASWDETMPKPPKGWRLSIVSDDMSSLPNGIQCPEEYSKINCIDCKFCLLDGSRNVFFTEH